MLELITIIIKAAVFQAKRIGKEKVLIKNGAVQEGVSGLDHIEVAEKEANEGGEKGEKELPEKEKLSIEAKLD